MTRMKGRAVDTACMSRCEEWFVMRGHSFCWQRMSGRSRLRRGQGLVELAMILPFLLLILVGVIDLGRMFFAYAAISNAAYEAARQAARGSYLYTPCVLNNAGTACDTS